LGKRKRVVTTAEEEEWEEASVVVVLAVVGTSPAGASGLDLLEAVSVAVASTQQLRRSVACTDPLEWERAEAELASAYRATLHLERVRYIGGLSIIMDELADQ
jgi:hypothetical protein